jgi:hypothetical protein
LFENVSQIFTIGCFEGFYADKMAANWHILGATEIFFN